MKKSIFFLLAIIVANCTTINAQVDQLTALKNIPEKTEFIQSEINQSSDGTLSIYPKKDLRVLSYKHNDLGKVGSFYILENYVSNKEAEPAQPRPDHPTKPAIFYSTFTGVGEVIIGNFVYNFKRNKVENILNGNFKISRIFEVKSDDKKTFKAQQKGKTLKNIDHINIIKEYFAAMKKIQANASENMSAADKEEAALAKKIQEEKERKRMAQVSADFNKGKQASAIKVAFKNTTAKNICIVQVEDNGNKSSHTIHENNQGAFPCNATYYYAADKYGYCGTDVALGTLILNKDNGCNQTIEIE